MFMRRLVQFAERHDDELPPIGYARKRYHWIVIVTHDGRIECIPAEKGDQRIIPDLSRSSGVAPILLTDKAEYVFGLAKDPMDAKSAKRAEECHHAYIKLLHKCYQTTQHADIQKIADLLTRRNFQLPETMKPEDNIIFRTGIDSFPHEVKEIKQFWESQVIPDPQSQQQPDRMCFICGHFAPAVQRHTVMFAIGRDRTKLISANDSAYMSYGLENSEVAPTCYSCEQKYGQALSYLLRRFPDKGARGGPHMLEIGDVTYVYWARHNDAELTGWMTQISDPTPVMVQRILTSPITGTESYAGIQNMCILALSANKARLVIRDYSELSVWQLKNQIRRFFEAQQVTGSRPSSIFLLAACMYRDANKEMEKQDVQEWMNWALHGKRISERVAVKIVRRIQAGGAMNWVQAAAIRSWLISQNREGWTMELDDARITPPYLCGRLFAVLEAVQYEAVGGNETIASRYYASASTVPNAIFGMLIRSSKWHLSKIGKTNKGYEIRYHGRFQHITGRLHVFPGVLSLPEQAEFALGYYHERQEIYKTKEDAVATATL